MKLGESFGWVLTSEICVLHQASLGEIFFGFKEPNCRGRLAY